MKKVFAVLLVFVLMFSAALAETVLQMDYKLQIMDKILVGQYTGEVTKGKPNGYGIFETETPDGTACHYIGEWKNGIMQGRGAMYWDNGSLEIGNYRDGCFIAGKYNYNGLILITAEADDEESVNPYWMSALTNTAWQAEDEHTVRYIGNKSSHVFHKLDCDSVRTMKEKNKVELYSREEAIEKKYKPCGRCNP